MKRLLLGTSVLALALAGCSSDGDAQTTAGADRDATNAAGETLAVSTAFYPLQFAVEQIGGDLVEATSLTPPGAEAHDVELTPREVARLTEDDLIVYLSGFQPAVDQAVANVAGEQALDVEPFAELSLTGDDHGHDHGDVHRDDHRDDHGHGDEATDPHFWLDPMRYAAVAQAIGDRFAEIDQDNAQTYQSNSQDFQSRLAELDAEFTTALASCAHEDLVTSHAAFGYLADRYDLHQVGIAGLTPDMEPSAAELRDLIAHVREAGVSTVYAETLVDPALAETIAREAGVEVRMLDPLEGLTDASAGSTYFEVMRSNLDVLTAGQECS
ncbi:MAG: zinc ABC transporter substrate-binding protein [Intrasporangiaceae bacterium]|nr:zinc ABC transporter substrate-binding protein [Intrasporangiaceae bacterium]